MKMQNKVDEYQKSELLYRGLNGREVYRVFMNPEESYILKSSTWWHSLPITDIQQASLKGQKPTYLNMINDLLSNKTELLQLTTLHTIDPTLILELFSRMKSEKLSEELVFSHGDLHVGNYTVSNDQLIIIDWEHTHLSCRYWDLYHLFDLSHPLYPKGLALTWRSRLLDFYVEKAMHSNPRLDLHRFIYEYNLFASVFSLWLLKIDRG